MTEKQRIILDEVSITVNWDSLSSIELSEHSKEYLENKGYTLINSFGGLYHSVLVYALYK